MHSRRRRAPVTPVCKAEAAGSDRQKPWSEWRQQREAGAAKRQRIQQQLQNTAAAGQQSAQNRDAQGGRGSWALCLGHLYSHTYKHNFNLMARGMNIGNDLQYP